MLDYPAIAEEIIGVILERHPGNAPIRSANGIGIPHALWLATTLRDEGRKMSEGKCGRWLGYLQALLVVHYVSTLEAEKQRNLRHRVEEKKVGPQSFGTEQWLCPSCDTYNHEIRTKCRSCGKPRGTPPEAETGHASSPS
jgi:hypothetical protein